MKKIGLISDTHGHFAPRLTEHFKECDEIWHAGDIGTVHVAEKLEEIAPVKAVYGNIDGQDLRARYPHDQRFKCEDIDVWITHIGGYPGNYDRFVREAIKANPPKLFICGHSHILKVMNDKTLDLLHMNPGAAGKSGFHKVITVMRFTIDGKEIKDLEVIELEKRK